VITEILLDWDDDQILAFFQELVGDTSLYQRILRNRMSPNAQQSTLPVDFFDFTGFARLLATIQHQKPHLSPSLISLPSLVDLLVNGLYHADPKYKWPETLEIFWLILELEDLPGFGTDDHDIPFHPHSEFLQLDSSHHFDILGDVAEMISSEGYIRPKPPYCPQVVSSLSLSNYGIVVEEQHAEKAGEVKGDESEYEVSEFYTGVGLGDPHDAWSWSG